MRFDLRPAAVPSVVALAVAAGISHNQISWDSFGYRVAVYGSTTNDRGVSIKLGETTDNVFTHTLPGAATWYYWVRGIDSMRREVGAWNPSGGTSGIRALSRLTTELDIATGAVTAAKLAVAGINSSTGALVLADGAVTAAKLAVTAINPVTGNLAAGAIYTGSLSANQITSGTIAAGVVYAGSVSANNISAGTLSSSVSYTGSLSATQINSGTLSADRIYGGTIGASVVYAGTVAADKISAGTLSGMTVSGGSIDIASNFTVTTTGVASFKYLYNKTTAGWIVFQGNPASADASVATFENVGAVQNSFAATARVIAGGSSQTYAFAGRNIPSGRYALLGCPGVGVYCIGGYSPFTGVHDAVMSAEDIEAIEIGDIVVDIEYLSSSSVSDTIFLVARSSIGNDKRAIGVLSSKGILLRDDIPAAFIESTSVATVDIEVDGVVVPRDQYTENTFPIFDDYKDDHYSININALGEGRINVCGEGGDIEPGDFIVTSSMPGKGMRQTDDLVHNYTVAKAREAVLFNDLAEVKQVACIYLCG